MKAIKIRPAILFFLFVAIFPIVSAASSGDPDPSFGASGVVVTSIAGRNTFFSDVVVQPDRKVVAVGQVVENMGSLDSTSQILVVRHNPDGSLDGSFGSGGIVATPIGLYAFAYVVARQSDGKILVGGSANIGDREKYYQNPLLFVLLRYDSSGALDPSFGDGGVVTAVFNEPTDAYGPVPSNSVLEDLVIQSDGRIVVTGTRGMNAIVVSRYETNGALDTTFGSGGTTLTPVGLYCMARSIARYPDDSLVVAGFSESSSILLRYDANGNPVLSFGQGGTVKTRVSRADWWNEVAIQPDGKIVTTGFTAADGNELTVGRYDTDGVLDPTFGIGGIVQTQTSDSSMGWDLELLSNGRILVGGRSVDEEASPTNAGASGFVIQEFLPNGDLDTTFQLSGAPTADENQVIGLALDGDGFVVAAGFTGTDDDTHLDYSAVVTRHSLHICGDGIHQSSEPCEDGNVVDGDGCDSNCTLTGCGNGIVTSGEQCDGDECCSPQCTFTAAGSSCSSDGNDCTDDECNGSGVCAHPGNTNPCDDSDLCTFDDVCGGGVCAGTYGVSCDSCQYCEPTDGACHDGPRPDCRGTLADRSSSLSLTSSDLAPKRQLKWGWANGEPTSIEDLGDPIASDHYDVCMFGGGASPASSEVLWDVSLPAGSPRWISRGPAGFAYRDRDGDFGGIRRLTLQPALDGSAAIKLIAKGQQLSTPTVSGDAVPIVMQVQRGREACWQATLDTDGRTAVHSTSTTRRFSGR